MEQSQPAGRGAIVHEWIEATGGSEKVVDAMARVLPGTDIVCLWDNAPGRYPGHTVAQSVIARTPLRGRKALSTPFVPIAWRRRVNRDYDWAVVSSHQFAHHVSFRDQRTGFQKYVYVHTPARYLWDPELDPRGKGPGIGAIAPSLRRIDRRRAAEAESIAVNSAVVQQRVETCWERASVIIHPPVDITLIQSLTDWSSALKQDELVTFEALPEEFLLGASRLVSYKRLDDVLRMGSIARLPVVIAGTGPERQRLQAQAEASGVSVTFVGRVPDEMLFALYQRAVAYVFPAIEDFGMMPVEAMATGARVIASTAGGTAETVVDGSSGVLCDFRSPSEVSVAMGRLMGLHSDAARQRATMFSAEIFAEKFADWIRPLGGAKAEPDRSWVSPATPPNRSVATEPAL